MSNCNKPRGIAMQRWWKLSESKSSCKKLANLTNLELAVGRLREAQRVHSEITQQVEGLVHLRAQQLAEYRDEIAHQQQIVIDEIVMRQWSRRDADATA
jgi:flagellar biosynthesis chaperone FliJ